MKNLRIIFIILLALICFIASVNATNVTFDPTNFIANYGTFGKQIAALMKQLEQLNNQRVQITNQVNQIRYMKTNSDSLGYLTDLKKSWEDMEKSLDGTVDGASDFEGLHAEFEEAYPDLTVMPDLEITGVNFENMRKKNYSNVSKSMSNAIASQSTLDGMKDEHDKSDKLLKESQAAEGQKQVAQASNQYLSLLGSKLDRLTTIIAAQNKADTTYFQANIQEQEAAQLQQDKRMDIDVEALKKQQAEDKKIAKKRHKFN